MAIIFAGPVFVHYGLMFLANPDHAGELIEARAGQANGLCGARVRGGLSLVTGLHTGAVHVVVEWLEAQPPLDTRWEDIVEVSFEIDRPAMILSAFEHHFPVVVPATGPHRARYSASAMDAGHDLDTTEGEALAPDTYVLQLWPQAPTPDEVIKQTSNTAAYWHAVAREHA